VPPVVEWAARLRYEGSEVNRMSRLRSTECITSGCFSGGNRACRTSQLHASGIGGCEAGLSPHGSLSVAVKKQHQCPLSTFPSTDRHWQQCSNERSARLRCEGIWNLTKEQCTPTRTRVSTKASPDGWQKCRTDHHNARLAATKDGITSIV
jgi:hypothetical protein